VNLNTFKHIYFIGIGGIGMSALARYFNQMDRRVSGYDRYRSVLCQQLIAEGIAIHFEDRGKSLSQRDLPVEETLVVYTPAIPEDHEEYQFFAHHGYTVIKRSALLGELTKDLKALTVAGTHGKTTTSALLAHVLRQSELKTSAFLGGISTNYSTNMIHEHQSEYVVVEADEFDRSFLYLHPFASIVTSTDADHMDIYKNTDELKAAFQEFTDRIHPQGWLIRHIDVDVASNVAARTYGRNSLADYCLYDLRTEEGYFTMDLRLPDTTWKNIQLGLPGIHNAENATAVVALLHEMGVSEQVIRRGLSSFQGVKRRFEYHVRSKQHIYVDDYAHHPTAINQLVDSMRLLYPEKKITAIFQPHLYSRTRDFMQDFQDALSRMDRLLLLPIYPARETPIEGVTSAALAEGITTGVELLNSGSAIMGALNEDDEVVLSIGAGDIDQWVEPIKRALQ